MSLPDFSQPTRDPAFVQDPYPAYDRLRALGPLARWVELDLPCAAGFDTVNALLRDRRFGREMPADLAEPVPERLAPFYAVDALSMLEREPPEHTRLRRLVTRAFTPRRIEALAPFIAARAHELVDAFPDGPFDLLPAFATQIPIDVITTLLGVPGDRSADLLAWSHAMVKMYQPDRSRAEEDAAVTATLDFVAYLEALIADRRAAPGDDLLSELIAAEAEGDRLSAEELTSTCILLLNAGHEATVHAIGNAVAGILSRGDAPGRLFATPEATAATVEETLRHDPPLHLFTRIALGDIEVEGHRFARGDRVGLLLGAANRDPARWTDPAQFEPSRHATGQLAFGAGLHFCIGAPLARLELATALPILFARCPDLRLAAPPTYADSWHFHGLTALTVTR
ncbi:cytochrome P450 [Oceanomicrobium pacificus]|uniref:Cytochrome P450 n=1 Tax=Oceanomicrobium pacificus TaxID=2692916 RepID=A0A6B0TTP9_9RHOB|nr:cytochrome P450 [Oceanomicrobium pacificus]MXU66159.1 cytochrome P450 [Oceanomicrobium pacificus]